MMRPNKSRGDKPTRVACWLLQLLLFYWHSLSHRENRRALSS
jgi:hypothetical protein